MTSAFVGVEDQTGVRGVYVNSDGYVDGVGKTLVNFYTTLQSARELVALGDLSSIDKGSADAYHRDWKEKWSKVQPRYYRKASDFWRASRNNASYIYLFRKDGWYLRRHDEKTFKRISPKVLTSPSQYGIITNVSVDSAQEFKEPQMNGIKVISAQNNVVTVEVKSFTDQAVTYRTGINVTNGDCICTCPQHRYRVAEAANLLKVQPNAKTPISCKHAQKIAAEFGG